MRSARRPPSSTTRATYSQCVHSIARRTSRPALRLLARAPVCALCSLLAHALRRAGCEPCRPLPHRPPLLRSCKTRTRRCACEPSTSRACMATPAAGTARPWNGWRTASTSCWAWTWCRPWPTGMVCMGRGARRQPLGEAGVCRVWCRPPGVQVRGQQRANPLRLIGKRAALAHPCPARARPCPCPPAHPRLRLPALAARPQDGAAHAVPERRGRRTGVPGGGHDAVGGGEQRGQGGGQRQGAEAGAVLRG